MEKEIKDAKVVEKTEVKNEAKEKKKGKKGKVAIVVVLFIILIFVAFIIALHNVGLLNFDTIVKPKEKVTLNYTTPNTQVKEGVYVTDVSEVVEEVMPSIVAITSKTLVKSGMYGPSFFGGQQYSEGAGSGIIINQNDDEILILTNNHVIEDAEELSVQFVDGKSADAIVKGFSTKKDVAVIAVKLSNLDADTKESIKIATIGDSNQLKVGNGVIAIGNALGYGQSVTTGVVSALNREIKIDNVTYVMIQIDAAINGGNSGGALLNSAGEVVGINSAKYSSSGLTSSASIEGMGFAIPISDVKELIESLMNGGADEDDPVIGITGSIISSGNSLNMPAGFYITEVIDGSGAEKAGLEVGNIITKIEGKNVTNMSDFQNVLSKKKKGDTITLVISYAEKNSYKEKEVNVELS